MRVRTFIIAALSATVMACGGGSESDPQPIVIINPTTPNNQISNDPPQGETAIPSSTPSADEPAPAPQPEQTPEPSPEPAIDSDEDGLSDSDEATRGTRPDRFDTDQDNLGDGQEVLTYGTNPLRADSDLDGWIDGDEVNQGTDPNNPSDNPTPEPPPSKVFIPEGGGHYQCGEFDMVFSGGSAVSNGDGLALGTYSIDNSVITTRIGNYIYEYIIEGNKLRLNTLSSLGDNSGDVPGPGGFDCQYASGERIEVQVINVDFGYLCSSYSDATDTWLWQFQSDGKILDENYSVTGEWYQLADGDKFIDPTGFDVTRIKEASDRTLTLNASQANSSDWGFCQPNARQFEGLPKTSFTMMCGTDYYRLNENKSGSKRYQLNTTQNPDDLFSLGRNPSASVVSSNSVMWEFNGSVVSVYGPNPTYRYRLDTLVDRSSNTDCKILFQK